MDLKAALVTDSRVPTYRMVGAWSKRVRPPDKGVHGGIKAREIDNDLSGFLDCF